MTYDLKNLSAQLSGCDHFSGDRLFCFGRVDSTNSWMASRKNMHGSVCLANEQLAGKGRMGRSWQAPVGGAVLMSLGWYLNGSSPSGLSLLSGVAVARALERCDARNLTLKWPNDILVDGSKLGGILVELAGSDCVIGIGINVTIPPKYGIRIDQPWIDLESLGARTDRNCLAAEIILEHDRLLPQFQEFGFAGFMDEWNQRCAHRNKEIEVMQGGKKELGRCFGVDQTGALIIQAEGVSRKIVSGEVSIRAL